MIPILDELEEAMKNPSEYNWREIKPNGSVDLTRILLRKTIYEAIDQIKRKALKIDNPGHPYIGKILINVLFSAIYAMANNRRDFSTTNESDTWMSQLRCLMGLILSVMASGANRPFSLVYQVILFEHKTSEVKINLATPEENLWLREMMKIWPWLKLDKVNVKQNAIDNVFNQIIEKSKCLKEPVAESKKLKEKKENYARTMIAKAEYCRDVLRPLVIYILKFKMPNVLNEEDYYLSLTENGTYKDSLEKEMEFAIHENVTISPDEKMLMQQKMQKILTQKKKQDFRYKFTENSLSEEHAKSLLLKYKEIKKVVEESPNEKLKYYYKQSRFFKTVSDMCKHFEETNEVKINNLNIIYSLAKEMYLKMSLFLYDDLVKLNNYLFKTHTENAKEKKILKEEIYTKLQGITIQEKNERQTPVKLMEKYGDTIKLEEISKRVEKRRTLAHSTPFSLNVANSLKDAVMSKCLRFVDLSQDYSKIHKVFVVLIRCESESDYQSKEFKDLLNDYLKMKFTNGHFMSGYLRKEEEEMEEEQQLSEREKNEKILNLYLTKDENLKEMFKFLRDYGGNPDRATRHCLRAIQQN